jgi:hypothetical protein
MLNVELVGHWFECLGGELPSSGPHPPGPPAPASAFPRGPLAPLRGVPRPGPVKASASFALGFVWLHLHKDADGHIDTNASSAPALNSALWLVAASCRYGMRGLRKGRESGPEQDNASILLEPHQERPGQSLKFASRVLFLRTEAMCWAGSAQELDKLGFECRPVFELAFPDGEHLPAGILQLAALAGVALLGAFPFCRPKLGIRFGGVLADPAVMEVPEAAVDEDDLPPAGEDQIRVTRKPGATGPAVQPVPVPLRVEEAAYQQFRLGVFAPDPGHIPAALLGGELIRHTSSLGAWTHRSGCSPSWKWRPLMEVGTIST